MASAAHCAFCFDVLSAHLSRRDHLSLSEVQESWDEYLKEPVGIDGGAGEDVQVEESADGQPAAVSLKQLPALRRLANSSTDSSSASSDSVDSAAGSGMSTPGTSVSDLTPNPSLPITAEYPLFVTWNTLSTTLPKDDEDYRSLRGCIGTFEARPLSAGLAEFALTAALEDTRFEQIRARELSRLEVAVTLLTDFEDADDEMDWTIGEHGLRISFWHNGRRYGATYLPDVASEQGWTKEETLVSLMRKSGWMGNKSRWRDIKLRVVRYKGKKASLPYADYEEWLKWKDGKNGGGEP